MKVIKGNRSDLVEKEKDALIRFVTSTDKAESQAAKNEMIAIDKCLRPRGILTLAANRADKNKG